MTGEDDFALVVEFKLVLVRAVEEYVLSELAAAARIEGRRLPRVARHLVRTGALAAVMALGPGDVARFASGPDWAVAFRRAVKDGSWTRLVEAALRAALPPPSA